MPSSMSSFVRGRVGLLWARPVSPSMPPPTTPEDGLGERFFRLKVRVAGFSWPVAHLLGYRLRRPSRGARLRYTARSRNVERGAVMASVTIDVDLRGRGFSWHLARLPSGVIIPVWPQEVSGDGIRINPLGPDRTGTVASVTIEVDLPPGVEITGYERHQDGHGFEVRWPLPERCRCERCGHEDRAHIEFKTTPQADPGPRRLGPAQLLDLPGPLPSLCAVRLPPAHHPSVQAEGHGLHLPLRAVRAPVADRQHRGGRRPPPGDLRRDGGTDRRVPVGRGSSDRSRSG